MHVLCATQTQSIVREDSAWAIRPALSHSFVLLCLISPRALLKPQHLPKQSDENEQESKKNKKCTACQNQKGPLKSPDPTFSSFLKSSPQHPLQRVIQSVLVSKLTLGMPIPLYTAGRQKVLPCIEQNGPNSIYETKQKLSHALNKYLLCICHVATVPQIHQGPLYDQHSSANTPMETVSFPLPFWFLCSKEQFFSF